jgi:hypothetical protein
LSVARPTISTEVKPAHNALVATAIRLITYVKSAALLSVGATLPESLVSSRLRTLVTLEVMYRESIDTIRVDTEKIARYNPRMCDNEFHTTEDDEGVEHRTVRVLQVEADSEEEAQAIAEKKITQCLQAEGYEGVKIVFCGVEPDAAV